jgi:hypothetical protein
MWRKTLSIGIEIKEDSDLDRRILMCMSMKNEVCLGVAQWINIRGLCSQAGQG